MATTSPNMDNETGYYDFATQLQHDNESLEGQLALLRRELADVTARAARDASEAYERAQNLSRRLEQAKRDALSYHDLRAWYGEAALVKFHKKSQWLKDMVAQPGERAALWRDLGERLAKYDEPVRRQALWNADFSDNLLKNQELPAAPDLVRRPPVTLRHADRTYDDLPPLSPLSPSCLLSSIDRANSVADDDFSVASENGVNRERLNWVELWKHFIITKQDGTVCAVPPKSAKKRQAIRNAMEHIASGGLVPSSTERFAMALTECGFQVSDRE